MPTRTLTLTLPVDSAERKNYPMFRGLLGYAPAALAGIAHHSFVVGAKHTPGEEMHHARGRSGDHPDCIMRHMVDINDMIAAIKRAHATAARDANAFIDNGGPEYVQQVVATLLTEVNALGWRALMWGQELHEVYGGAPLAPSARLPAPDPVAVAEAAADRDNATTTFAPPVNSSPESTYRPENGARTPPSHTCAMGSREPCAACDALTAAGGPPPPPPFDPAD